MSFSLDEFDNIIILKFNKLAEKLSYDEYSKSNFLVSVVEFTKEKEIEINFNLCDEYTFNKIVQYLKLFKHIKSTEITNFNVKQKYTKDIHEFFDKIYNDSVFCDKLFLILNVANYLHINSLIYFTSYKYSLIINNIPDLYFKDLPFNEEEKYVYEELEIPKQYKYLFESINENGNILKKRNFDTCIWYSEYTKNNLSL
jgi:hypothetical protein